MKFSGGVLIKKSKSLVVKYFADPTYLVNYQDGFLRKEFVSGNPGHVGAIAKMYYKFGKGEMEITETIISNMLPDSFEAQYHHKHTDNTMKCTFVKVDENQTRYEYEVEYTRLSGFMLKLITFFYPSMLKKQVDKWMVNFKIYVEST